MSKRPKKPALVECGWIDARDLNETYALADIPERVKLIHRTTCGYLVYQDEERTVLAKDWDPGEDPPEAGNFTAIPSGWIRTLVYKSRKPKAKKAADPPAEV